MRRLLIGSMLAVVGVFGCTEEAGVLPPVSGGPVSQYPGVVWHVVTKDGWVYWWGYPDKKTCETIAAHFDTKYSPDGPHQSVAFVPRDNIDRKVKRAINGDND